MANTCFVTITVKCDGREEFERLCGHLENEIRKADAERRGLCLGSDRCLFDEYMELEGDELKINGCVKWGYDDEEVIALLNYLKGVATVSRLKLEYEMGSLQVLPSCDSCTRYLRMLPFCESCRGK